MARPRSQDVNLPSAFQMYEHNIFTPANLKGTKGRFARWPCSLLLIRPLDITLYRA